MAIVAKFDLIPPTEIANGDGVTALNTGWHLNVDLIKSN